MGSSVRSESSSEPLLRARGLVKEYATGSSEPLRVLDGLELDVRPGEIVAITGESGSGKSTLLHILGALERPTEGQLQIEGQDVFSKDDEALAHFRNRSIGFVFQFHHLLPEFSALENVAMPALIRQQSLEDARPRAVELLEVLGLGHRLEHRPNALSGGEQQRVAVARALMNRPRLVLADEPTGNLDLETAERLHEEILRLRDEFDQAFVLATHSAALGRIADRRLHLERGQLAERLPSEAE